MAEDLGDRAERILDILGEANIGAARGALGRAAVSLLTEVSNSDFENWIKALRDGGPTPSSALPRRERSSISSSSMTAGAARSVPRGRSGRRRSARSCSTWSKTSRPP
jgi:hypothetical protein